MTTSPSDLYRAVAGPHNALTTTRRLDLDSGGDASIALAEGAYELKVMGSLGAWVVPGATAAALAAIASGDAAQTGFHLASGAVVTYHHDATVGDGALHALPDDEGAGILLITRKVA